MLGNLSILQNSRKGKNYEKVGFSGHNGFDGIAGFGSSDVTGGDA
jgi:hypothetical protein